MCTFSVRIIHPFRTNLFRVSLLNAPCVVNQFQVCKRMYLKFLFINKLNLFHYNVSHKRDELIGLGNYIQWKCNCHWGKFKFIIHYQKISLILQITIKYISFICQRFTFLSSKNEKDMLFIKAISILCPLETESRRTHL